MNGLLDEIAADPASPAPSGLRQNWSGGCVERLKNDEEALRDRSTEMARFLAHPGIARYGTACGTTWRSWLASDMARPDSRIRARLASAATAIGASLAANPACAIRSMNIERTVEGLAPPAPRRLSEHIAGTVRAWRDEDLTEIEHSVGRDLQFIRAQRHPGRRPDRPRPYAPTHPVSIAPTPP